MRVSAEMEASATGDAEIDEAIAAHDRRVADAGLTIWIGGEPTFTDRLSFEAEWNAGALGEAKEARGQRAVAALASKYPGAALLRTVGRQYPDEAKPRWSYGVFARRDGTSVWRGPPDPLCGGGRDGAAAVEGFVAALARRARGRALTVEAPLAWRMVVGDIELDPSKEPELARLPWHLAALPPSGPADALAARGVKLLSCGVEDGCVRLELPAHASTEAFCETLELIAAAASDAALTGLVLGGFAPPVDASIAWTSVTPDPGVLEFNLAPHDSIAGYARLNDVAYALADAFELSPYRAYFNGDLADSGGGGQLTFGGPSAERSPFFVHPHLLPRLVVYLNRHPSLSYWLGLDAVGGSSQAPRADEGARETYEELGVALDALHRDPAPTPEALWSSLGPLLTDRFGNGHRAEVNVEKLWNPYLPLRGQLGLVELRALRMPRDRSRATAVAVLLRSVLAHLATTPYDEPLIEWGAALHDRFALPFYLLRDLDAVLAELAQGGFGVAPVFTALLRDDSHLRISTLELQGLKVSLRRAREFWPLLGDVSQEAGTHRLVDPSTNRTELMVSAADGGGLEGVTLTVAGRAVPLRRELTEAGEIALIGIRHRAFVPALGLHPLVPAHGPLAIELAREGAVGTRLTLHSWSADGAAYEGLPRSLAEAASRRAARVVAEPWPQPAEPPLPAPPRALSDYAVDLRRW